MKQKKWLGLLAAIMVMTVLFAACTAPDSSSSATLDKNAISQDKADTGNVTDTDDAGVNVSEKVLVAYFSHTGNTESVAEIIAENTGGDLAEIKRAKDYDNLYEQGEAEIKDGAHPEIIVSVDDIESYDTVFVGYPIWWKEAPAMIATFLAQYDFSRKTLIPFCTSSSDTIDASLHIFSELCPNSEIADGLTANNEEDIQPWLERLGLLKSDAMQD